MDAVERHGLSSDVLVRVSVPRVSSAPHEIDSHEAGRDIVARYGWCRMPPALRRGRFKSGATVLTIFRRVANWPCVSFPPGLSWFQAPLSVLTCAVRASNKSGCDAARAGCGRPRRCACLPSRGHRRERRIRASFFFRESMTPRRQAICRNYVRPFSGLKSTLRLGEPDC